MTKVKITRNYPITLPEEVRKKVKLVEGDTVEVEAIDSKEVRLKQIIPLKEHRRSLGWQSFCTESYERSR